MDKCQNVKELPGICDGLPVFCRGCTESVNRCTQLMKESRDEAKAEVRRLRLDIENIVTRWKAEKDAMVLQNGELKKALREAVGLIEGRPNPYGGNIETWKALLVAEKPIREGDGHICIAAEEVPCSLCGRVTEKQKPESALGPEMTPMERILMEAVNEFCSCGGAGPENGCVACKIWHRHVAKSRKV
jgi:hypothetical protein